MTSSLLSRAASNSQLQLATTALVSGLAVAISILSYQRLAQESRLFALKSSIPPSSAERAEEDDGANKRPRGAATGLDGAGNGTADLPPIDPDDIRTMALARRAQAGDYDEEVILEQLARNRAFLTPAGLEKLRSAVVVVVGCGGVGSHCAAALARSGVSRIRLVDFDQVSLSSLNRHAVATLQDVGNPKVNVLARRLLAVTPWVRFDLRLRKFDDGSAPSLLGPWVDEGASNERKIDFVVDAIDNIDTKVSLLKYCHDHGLPVISSMGAGTKSDPTRVMVGDIGASTDDRLSRATRRRLKLLGVTSGIPVIYSTEPSGDGKAELLPLPEEQFQKGKEAVRELGVIQDFRVRILPVLGTMPAVFGYTAANHVILSITGYPTDYAAAKGRDKMYEGILTHVQGLEDKVAKKTSGDGLLVGLKVPLTLGDVAFLVEEVYRGRSAVSGVPTRLTLIRWERPRASTLLRLGEGEDEQKSAVLRLSDLVCMTRDEATRHMREVLLGAKGLEELYGCEVIERVEARRREAREAEKYRA